MADKPKNSPVWQKKSGLVQLAVWKNTNKNTKTGEEFDSFSFDLKRSYKDGDAWKDTTSMRPADLPRVSALLNAASQWWFLEKAAEAKEDKE